MRGGALRDVQPFSGVGWSVPAFQGEGQDATRARANPELDLEAVHPGYFETFGLPIVRGRAFVSSDRAGAALLLLLSALLASALPAWRASKTNPADGLREQ